jgi:ABC-type multidrug transport system ATPase subunit
VFDDPVTSLDQNYKEKIASLITGLSTNRQVIILTHDLNFVRLLIDESNKAGNNGYKLIGLKSYNGISGITTDEIPYLAKNIQERINSIRSLTNEIKGISPTQVEKIEEKVEIASKRIRFLLEKSVEDILANKSIQRFSKNINLKAKQLSGYVVTEKSDIEFLLKLFGKYSVPEHDGGVSTEYQKPSLVDITNDLADFEKWKNDFATKQNDFIKVNGY